MYARVGLCLHPQSLVTGPGRILQAGAGKLPHLAGAHPSNGERS